MIPDLSVLWVIFFVLVLAVTLDRFLFSPITRVMREREHRVRSARELAEGAARQTQEATADLEGKTRAAREELYREMDEKRRLALDRRAELLARTRNEAETSIAEAAARVKTQSEEARARLDQEAGALSIAIVERVLGRKVS